MALVDSRTPFPYQQHAFVAALLQNASGEIRALSLPGAGSFVFCKAGTMATSLVEGAGLLSLSENLAQCSNWPAETADILSVTSLYFPLLYQGTTAFERLRVRGDVWMVERRPSCAITLPVSEGSLLRRSALRIGKRAHSRVDRFRDAGGEVVTLRGNDAVDAVEHIELRSWKRQSGQDMLSRNQFAFFAELMRTEGVLTRIARVDGQAIAYRLDCQIGSRVYSIKWSFDEDFRRLSPGFHMIVSDLEDYYGNDTIDLFDLYGSPDTLKSVVCDALLPRFDFIWPATLENRQFLAQREEFDKDNAHWLNLGMAIRRNYDARGTGA